MLAVGHRTCGGELSGRKYVNCVSRSSWFLNSTATWQEGNRKKRAVECHVRGKPHHSMHNHLSHQLLAPCSCCCTTGVLIHQDKTLPQRGRGCHTVGGNVGEHRQQHGYDRKGSPSGCCPTRSWPPVLVLPHRTLAGWISCPCGTC